MRFKHKRGGHHLTTGTVGYMHPIRQQYMTPGERIDGLIGGQVIMESLRERDNLRMNANLSIFMTPIRWLDTAWTGWATEQGGSITYTDIIGDNIGLGGTSTHSAPEFWLKAPERIYNEWYRWPEDPDITWAKEDKGQKAVPLEHTWTRMREDDPEIAEGIVQDTQGTYTDQNLFHVYDLRETQAAFESHLKGEYLTQGRYMEALQQLFGTTGSREVDQVPILIKQHSIGVEAKNIAATDAAGLGKFTSIYDFGVAERFTAIAPEHCVLTYILTVRFLSITEERHPFATNNFHNDELRGVPNVIGAMRPQLVSSDQLLDTASGSDFGYLPGGWQLRCRNNVVGAAIKRRQSFPYMQQPTSLAQTRDATLIGNPFRSQSLDDYVIELNFTEDSTSMIPPAGGSFMDDAKGMHGDDFPFMGKLK